MKRTLWVVAVLCFACSAFAQFMPPARDLQDVLSLTTEYQRLTRPAFAEPGKWAEGLVLITSVHISLRNEPAPMAIDNALEKIKQWEAKHERDDPPPPKEVVRYVKLVKTWLEDAKSGPSPNLYTLREQIHHEVMHPMQRYVLQQVEQTQNVVNTFQAMSTQLQARIGELAHAAANASPEKP